MQFRTKKRQSVDIGLIPMIDVLLVLLFFFMVATTFKQQSELKLNLPEASGSEQQQIDNGVNLFIDAQGKFALQDTIYSSNPIVIADLAGLKKALADLPESSHQLPFIINADGKTLHQIVVSALEAANQQGFHHITFAVDNTIEK